MRIIPTLLLWALASAVLGAQTPSLSSEQIAAFEGDLAELNARITPVTVGLRVGGASGSGVIVSEDGYVLTAAHLFRTKGQKAEVILHDGRSIEGETLGRMGRNDFGLIKITTEGTWPHAEMGRSGTLAEGDLCVGTGHPGGFDRNRGAPLRFGKVLDTESRFLRTSCVIDHGDSGGPLFDLEGRVIGIHSRIGRSPRQNFHVPVDHYRRSWKRLAAGDIWGYADFPKGPIVGIRGDEDPGGARILRVYPDLPAAKAELKARDLIVKVDGQAVAGMEDFKKLIARREVGDKVEVEVVRGDETLKKQLVLAASPDSERSGSAEPTTDMPVVEDEEDPVVAALESSDAWTAPLEDVVAPLRASVVTIRSGEDRRILGTLVSDDGWILTKASAIEQSPVCTLADGRELEAVKVTDIDEYDLALLKIEATDLTPVSFAVEPSWRPGQWLLSPRGDETARGVLSVLPRPIRGFLSGGYLGVQLGEVRDGGILVEEVMPDTAASKAGLVKEDAILGIDGATVKDRQELITKISGHRPDDVVVFDVRRDGKKIQVEATLGSRAESLARRSTGRRSRRGSRERDPYSRRRDGFALAAQHDTILEAAQCGGPVLDVQGRCVGINVARASRYSTLSIPSTALIALLQDHIPQPVEAMAETPNSKDEE